MSKSPTILYVINHIDWFWSHRLPLAQGALDAGYHVKVAVPGASQDKNLKPSGFEPIDLDGGLLKTIFNLRQIFKTHKPDIVHAITIKYAFIAGLAAFGLPNCKIVHTIAGLGYLFSDNNFKARFLRCIITPFLRIALRSGQKHLIFQNPDDMKIMISRGFASPSSSHLIRGSGVNIDQFTPCHNQENSASPIIVMPTRLVHDKGISIFVEAARLLRDRGVEVQMKIAGGVSKSNPLAINKSEMTAMTVDGATQWLGRVDDMPGLLASATLIAYPSHYREGIPKVLLEACAMGKAIITTDHPGCREAVRDGYNGILVPIKNSGCLATAIETLLQDPEQCKKMGKNSRKRAEEEFDSRLIVEQTITVYKAL